MEIFVAKHEKLNMFKNGLTKIDNITKFEVDFILFFTCRECLDISLMFQVSFNTGLIDRSLSQQTIALLNPKKIFFFLNFCLRMYP